VAERRAISAAFRSISAGALAKGEQNNRIRASLLRKSAALFLYLNRTHAHRAEVTLLWRQELRLGRNELDANAMSDLQPSSPEGNRSGSASMIPILFGAVLALMGASAYMLYHLSQLGGELDRISSDEEQLRNELAQTRDRLLAEIARIHETSVASMQTNKSSVDSLKAELEIARRQAAKLVGQAKVEATKHADELAGQLVKMQEVQAQQVTAMGDAVSQVKTDADATKTRVGEVSTEVGTVKTELTATKSEFEKTVAELKTTKGDLGIQSDRIATTAKELEALITLGARNYTPFTNLPKERSPRKIGDIQIRLKAADPKKNRFTIDVIADDKTVEKKDKTVNEPLQFMLSRSPQPYELVVNEVKKDTISGYLAAPKAQPRN
jgi:flagellar basal body-associated protein FliL